MSPECFRDSAAFPPENPIGPGNSHSRRYGKVTKQSTDFVPQFFPGHNHIDQAVFLEKLGGLKSFWQILVRCFFNHTRPGETDHAFGSAMITSPNEAKLAITPAVVGFVRTEMYGSFSSPWRASAPLVFAICIRLNIPSYIRAPPDAATMITAQRWVVPYSIVRVIFSPTTEPMVAARKPKSITAIATL